MNRFTKVMALFMAGAMVLTGCGSGTKATGGDAPKTETEAAGKKYKIAYVTPGATGDNGFCDSVASGLERIKNDYGAEIKIIENNNDASKYAESLEACFQWGPDIVFSEPYGFEELYTKYADEYPDVTMVCLDFQLENTNKTISSYTFISEEGAFLAGVTAAKVTVSDLDLANPDKKVGFVGGQDIPVIKGFLHGFEQGVKYVDPDIEVLVTYVGDFFDPVKGKTAAKQLYAQGADIIFQAAGTSGQGALEAAKEEAKYVIGVDSNQNGIYPDHVVTSMVKDLGGAVYDTFVLINDGTYEKDHLYTKGAGPSGVYLAIDDYTRKILPEEMINEINGVQDKILAGEVKVDTYKE